MFLHLHHALCVQFQFCNISNRTVGQLAMLLKPQILIYWLYPLSAPIAGLIWWAGIHPLIIEATHCDFTPTDRVCGLPISIQLAIVFVGPTCRIESQFTPPSSAIVEKRHPHHYNGVTKTTQLACPQLVNPARSSCVYNPTNRIRKLHSVPIVV